MAASCAQGGSLHHRAGEAHQAGRALVQSRGGQQPHAELGRRRPEQILLQAVDRRVDGHAGGLGAHHELLGALDDGQLLRQGMLLRLEVDAQLGSCRHRSCAGGGSPLLKVHSAALDQASSGCILQSEEELQCLSEGPLHPLLLGLHMTGVGAAAGGLVAAQQVAVRLNDQAQQNHARLSACGHAEPEAD